MGLRGAKASAGGSGTVDVDALPPAEYLILEVPAARWRLGERTWTFPIRLPASLDALQARGLMWWERASVPRAGRASLTDTGRAAVLRDSYIPPAVPLGDLAGVAPQAWAEWTWPGWVPVAVREQVEAFWDDNYGRGPRAWLRDIQQRHAPEFGAVATLGNGMAANPPPETGRYVHAWNNIGRPVLADGSVVCTSFNPSQPDGPGHG